MAVANKGPVLTPEKIEALRAVPLLGMPNRLRVALALAKVKQADVARATGIVAPNLSDIVNGKYKNVTVDTASKLAEYFGVAIEDLFPQREAVAS